MDSHHFVGYKNHLGHNRRMELSTGLDQPQCFRWPDIHRNMTECCMWHYNRIRLLLGSRSIDGVIVHLVEEKQRICHIEDKLLL